MSTEIILPGDPLPQLTPLLSSESSSSSEGTRPKTLRLGHGLTLSPLTPSTPILPTISGALHVISSSKKPSASIISTPRHYNPIKDDPVLVTLLRSTGDAFIVQLTPYTPPAVLPFDKYITNSAGTTAAVRKSRPNFSLGATIYARVGLYHKHLEAVELYVPGEPFGEVKSASSKSKAGGNAAAVASEAASAKPKTDYIINASQALIKILSLEETLGKPLISSIASRVAFEFIIGKNGRVWIDAESQNDVIKVARCLCEYDEREMWEDEDDGVKSIREMVVRICGR